MMERNAELEKMIVKFYNVQTGCSLRVRPAFLGSLYRNDIESIRKKIGL